MYTYELKPNTSQKSFYGKAYVVVAENGDRTLYSYNTKIITITNDGKMRRHWYDWSATTQKHIRAFCGLNKAEFTRL